MNRINEHFKNGLKKSERNSKSGLKIGEEQDEIDEIELGYKVSYIVSLSEPF